VPRIRVFAIATLLALALVVAAAVNVFRHADGSPAEPPASAAGALVTVDASAETGALNNPARYHNQIGPSQLLGAADERRIDQLAPEVVRAWFKPHRYYDHATRRYDFDYLSQDGDTTFYQYIDQVAGHTKEIFANFDQCDQSLMTIEDPQRCRAVLKAGIRHYKLRYPNLRYVELFNEPDKIWTPSKIEQPAIALADYYGWYRIGYSIVNELNRELRPAIPMRIGGPAAYTFNPEFLNGFLSAFQADPAPDKRLDFLSYHQYRRRADPAEVRTERETARQWLTARGLDPATPQFVSEYGVFPGANSGTTFEADLLTQAAAMATLGHYYGLGGTDMMLHWAYDHGENDRKSMLVDGDDGKVYPYYNVVAMQKMLKRRLLESGSNTLTAAGIGVNATATRDRSGIAVLTTNYQWTDGSAEHPVELRIANLPPEYARGEILVERYLVDAVTSNYTHDPGKSDLQRVERRTVPAGSSVSTTFHLGLNAVSLLVLTPAGA
jgi:hypothetical protein